jgi:hypothetical protein
MKSNRKHRIIEDKKGMIQMLPTVAFAVVMLFAIMYIGTYINGTIASELVDSYGDPADYTNLQTKSVNTLENLTSSYDSTMDIVVIAAIVTVLTLPLLAIVAVKRLF